MDRILQRIIIVTLVLLGVGNTVNAQAADQALLTREQSRMIDEYVEREMDASNIPGVSIGIVHGDEIIYTKGYGVADLKGTPVTEDTPFYIGSIGKTFTALAIRQLEGEGKLNTKEFVTTYIPWFTLADQKGNEITIEHLLDHTSGLSQISGNKPYSFNSKYSVEEAVREISKRERINRPVGSGYEYSNLNYVVLGLIVEVVSGLSYDDYVNEFVFELMGMDSTYARKDEAVEDGLAQGYRSIYGINIPTDYDYPIGQVPAGYQLSSARDMSKYMICYLSNGYYQGESILPNNQLQALQNPEDKFVGTKAYYGLDWGITKDGAFKDYNRFYGFMGATSNSNSAMLLSQVHRYGIVVLTNQRGSLRQPDLTAQVIGNGISDILLHGIMPAPVKVSYSMKSLYSSILALIFSLLSIYSCIRFQLRLQTKRKKLALLLILVINLILPGLFLISMPILYDNNWRYFLYAATEDTLPWLVLSLLLLITGFIKLLMLILNRDKNKRAIEG